MPMIIVSRGNFLKTVNMPGYMFNAICIPLSCFYLFFQPLHASVINPSIASDCYFYKSRSSCLKCYILNFGY